MLVLLRCCTLLFALLSRLFFRTLCLAATSSATLLSMFSEDDAEVQALVDESGLDLAKSLVDLVDFALLLWSEQLVHEELQREHALSGGLSSLRRRISGLVLGRWQGVRLREHCKQELEGVSGERQASSLEGQDELVALQVAIALCVGRGKRKLELDSLVGEDEGADVFEDLVWPAEAGLGMELDLLRVGLLDESDLDRAGVEGVQVVEDAVDVQVSEVLSKWTHDLPEVL